MVKANFIQDGCDRGKETSLQNQGQFQIQQDRWEFIAKEPGGVSGWEVTEDTSRARGDSG